MRTLTAFLLMDLSAQRRNLVVYLSAALFVIVTAPPRPRPRS